jgi:hypothetical protein
MRLTKDECRILSAALNEAKYDMVHDVAWLNEETMKSVFEKLIALQERLELAGNDERRQGRKSHNSLADCLKRYTS